MARTQRLQQQLTAAVNEGLQDRWPSLTRTPRPLKGLSPRTSIRPTGVIHAWRGEQPYDGRPVGGRTPRAQTHLFEPEGEGHGLDGTNKQTNKPL